MKMAARVHSEETMTATEARLIVTMTARTGHHKKQAIRIIES